MQKLYILLFFFVLAFSNTFSQQLEQIGKEKQPLKINGGISTNHVFYTASNIEQRREPYNYFITGNLNADLYGFSVPLTFSISNQNTSFQQPFNQFSLSPSYKWVKSYIGWSSMSFSNYTLAGHLFNGVGVDLTPEGIVQVSAMYGRLQKAVPLNRDTAFLDNNLSINQPAFKRMGTGVKTTFKYKKDQVDLILFRAWEDPNSIGFVPDSLQLRPQDNLVLSINVQKSLFDVLKISTEFASSAITRDRRVAEPNEIPNFYGNLGGFFRANASTTVYHAFKSSLSYQHSKFTLGANYERIEPEYRTLGAYFFNNDLENITGSFSTRLFRQKVQFSSNLGVQRNDLRNEKISKMNRVVGSANVSAAISSKVNLTTSYSNFQTFTNIRSNFITINQGSAFDNLDTLNYRQISQNATLNGSYQITSSSKQSQMFSANIVYQTSSDEQGGVSRNGGKFYNFNVSYNYNFNPQQLGITFSINANKNEVETGNSSTFGPTIGISKPTLKKQLKNSFSVSLNNAYQEGLLGNSILNLRYTTSYMLVKKHNFNLSLVALRRTQPLSINAPKAFNEFTATFGYSYNFSILGNKEIK
jgi:hypothetical protein